MKIIPVLVVLSLIVVTPLVKAVSAQTLEDEARKEKESPDILHTNQTDNAKYEECNYFYGNIIIEEQAAKAEQIKENATATFLKDIKYKEKIDSTLNECRTRSNLSLTETIACIEFIEQEAALNLR